MSVSYEILGHFSNPETASSAISALRKKICPDKIETYGPFPDHGIDHSLNKGRPKSWVRLFTLIGGVSGCLGAFLFTSWMSIDYPLRVSAKPLLSYPAFVIIAFECTILLAALFTVFSMFHFARIPNWFYFPAYRDEFSEGTFGLSVRVSKEEIPSVKVLLEDLGAEKVEEVYVRG